MTVKHIKRIEFGGGDIAPGQPSYLPDYYAILGVKRFSSQAEVSSAYRKLIAKWHPDLVARAAPQLQEAAREQTELLIEAYKTLTDQKKRKEYDQKLETTDPRLISNDGIPIEFLGRKAIDIGRLVSGEPWDGKKDYLKLAENLGGHDETTFAIIREKYKATKNPDPTLREAYFKAVVRKNAYLSILEQVAWRRAGISNQEEPERVLHPTGYLMAREAQIEAERGTITAAIGEVVKQLGPAEALRLLPPSHQDKDNHAESSNNPVALRDSLVKVTLEHFEAHKEEILNAAKERASLLEELVQFTHFEYVPQHQKRQDALMVLCSVENVIKLNLSYKLSKGKVQTGKSHRFEGLRVDDLKGKENKRNIEAALKAGANILILYTNPEIDAGLEQGHIVNRHFMIKKGRPCS